jgi:hypothetical protein
MPHTNPFDPPSRGHLLTCPNCFQSMRIKTIESADGRDRVTLSCDECRIEATQDKTRQP